MYTNKNQTTESLANQLQHEGSLIKWWIAIFAVVALLLLGAVLGLAHSICAENWVMHIFGSPGTCQSSINLPSASSGLGSSDIALELEGTLLKSPDGKIAVDLSPLAGQEGPAGVVGDKGPDGNPGSFSAASCGAGQASQWDGSSFVCVNTGGNLNDAYNFGGPAAGRVINATAINQPVAIRVPLPAPGINSGLEISGDGGAGNSVTSGMSFNRVNLGGPSASSAIVYSETLASPFTGVFGFNAFDGTAGAENFNFGLISPTFSPYGIVNINVAGMNVGSGNSQTAIGDGLDISLGAGSGGSTSGDGGEININAGSTPTDGNGGQISISTGEGKGITGTGGNFSVFANNGDLSGGAMNFNTGNGGTGDGGNIGFGMGSGGNNGGNFFITSGNGGVNGGGFNFNAGTGTTGFGGGVGFNGGNGPMGGGGFNFNGGNDLTNTFGGGGVGFNGGTGANGGGFSFNGGSGTSFGGGVTLNGGSGTTVGVSNGGGVSINGGLGLNGGTINLNSGNGDLSGADTGGGVTFNAGDGSNPGHIALFAGDALTSSGGTIGLFGGLGTSGGDLNLYGGNANLGMGGNGGNFIFSGGAADGAGTGGSFSVLAGTNATGGAGSVAILAGNGLFGGGSALLMAGSANAGGNASGGALNLFSGVGDGLGNGGDVNIASGLSSGGSGGNITISTGSGVTNGAITFGTGGTERGRFEPGGEFLVNTTTPVLGKVAVFNGDVNVTGVIDPTALLFSDTTGSSSYDPAANNGYRIGVTGATQRPVFVSPLADSTDIFQVRNAANTSTILDVDTSNGRVGIGTATPNTLLEVAGGLNSEYVRLNDGTGTVGQYIVDATPNGSLTATRGSIAQDYVNGALYINTDNATTWAQVAIASGSCGGTAFCNGGNSFGAAADLGTNDAFGLNLRTSGSTRLSVGSGGGITIGDGGLGSVTVNTGSVYTLTSGAGIVIVDGGTYDLTSSSITIVNAGTASWTSAGPFSFMGGAVAFRNSVDTASAFRVLDSTGATAVFNVDTTNQRVGIGTATPTEALDVVGNGQFSGNIALGGAFGSTVDPNIFVNVNATIAPGAPTTGAFVNVTVTDNSGIVGNHNILTNTAAAGTNGFMIGAFSDVNNSGGADAGLMIGNVAMVNNDLGGAAQLWGNASFVTNNSPGNIGNLIGNRSIMSNNDPASVVSNIYNSFSFASNSGTVDIFNANSVSLSNDGTITTSATLFDGMFSNTGTTPEFNGVNLTNWSNTGTVTTSRAIHIDDSISIGTNSWALASDSTADSYFAGSVGVGTTTPANKLDVTDTSTDSVASFTGTSGTCTVRTDLGTLDCPSDRTLKTNVLSISDGLNAILSLEGVTYNWKSTPDGVTVPGFIAQDVERVLPNLVTHHADGTLSLSKDGILPYLVEAVKTQNGKIDDVNKRLVDQGVQVVSISDELKALAARVDTLEKTTVDNADKIKALEDLAKKQAQVNQDLQEQIDQLKKTP